MVVYKSAKESRKVLRELFWVTTTLTGHHATDIFRRYRAWESEASLYVSIDVLINTTGIRHSAFEVHTATRARGLLVKAACALQHMAFIEEETSSLLDPSVLEDLVESLFLQRGKKAQLVC